MTEQEMKALTVEWAQDKDFDVTIAELNSFLAGARAANDYLKHKDAEPTMAWRNGTFKMGYDK